MRAVWCIPYLGKIKEPPKTSSSFMASSASRPVKQSRSNSGYTCGKWDRDACFISMRRRPDFHWRTGLQMALE